MIKFSPNKNSFKFISNKNTSKKGEYYSEIQEEELVNNIKDFDKRNFLKILGIAGLGLAATSLFPKKADALIVGSTPTSNVVGIKNIANQKINPAKEDGNLAILAGKDYATETTLVNIKTGTDNLIDIKTNSDKLQFDTNSNLKVITTGNSATQIKDNTGTIISPFSDESSILLRRIVKLMESQAVVDAGNRQKITMDSISAGVTLPTVSNVQQVSTQITLAGQNQQMYQDPARNAWANGIRRYLIN